MLSFIYGHCANELLYKTLVCIDEVNRLVDKFCIIYIFIGFGLKPWLKYMKYIAESLLPSKPCFSDPAALSKDTYLCICYVYIQLCKAAKALLLPDNQTQCDEFH